MTMENFVAAVQRLEDLNPNLTPMDLLASLLTTTVSQRDNITCGIIGSSDNTTDVQYTDSNNTFITENLSGNLNLCWFFNQAIHHFITDDREERGVVLTPDGTTVALSPLLLGVEMGLQATKDVTQPHGIYLLPLAKTLGLSFLQFENSTPPERLGPDGCWDNISSPVVFTVSEEPSLATDAVVHGGMDGAIIGRHLSVVNDSEVKLSEVLSSYYSDGIELDHGVSHLRGRYRRQNFQDITNASLLQKKVADALKSHRRRENAAEESLIEEGMREFALRYMGQ